MLIKGGAASRVFPLFLLSAWLCGLPTLKTAGVALGQATDSGDFVLEYTAATGNMTLIFTGTGSSGAGPVGMESLDIVTLGDTSGGHPAMPSGIPGVTPGQGGLNGVAATLPAASFQVLNTSSNGFNGIYSQVFNANVGSAWKTFDRSNPGVSDRLNLGNIAAPGWSYSNITSIFMTDPDFYGSYNYGKFGYSLSTGGGAALIGAVVPEPTSLVTLGSGVVVGVLFRRRRSTRIL